MSVFINLFVKTWRYGIHQSMIHMVACWRRRLCEMSIGAFCCCRREEAVGGEEVEEAYAMKARSSGYVDRFLGQAFGAGKSSQARSGSDHDS